MVPREEDAKTMKRVLVLVALGTVGAAIAVACSDNQQETPPEPPTPPPVAPDPPPPEPEPPPEPPPVEPAAAGTGEDQSDMDCEAEDANCPLFAWMQSNTVPAVEGHDLPALAAAMHKIEFLAPDPSWNDGDEGWAHIARDGATKAEANDFRGARAACKSCHHAWRDRFRQEGRRTAPVPELPENAAQGRTDL